MSVLFSPLKIQNLVLPNRIAVSPMCQYCATDGLANEWHWVHFGTLALSGAGMLFIEDTSVEPIGRITPGDLGLWDDDTEQAFAKLISIARGYSNIPIAIQLGHAGRKASSAVPWEGGGLLSEDEGGWATIGPSAVPQKDGEASPIALDRAGLERVKQAFADSAKRAARLGFDALEIHAAHGYLLHQFLSPISNQRDDEYGGSLENRLRYPIEVFEAVRESFPSDKPVGIKISATDWMEGGWDVQQTIAFAQELEKRGLAWISVSSGGISPQQKIVAGPGYQVPFAQEIKRATGLTVISVGLITEARQAEAIVAEESADAVALARAMLYNPRWPWHAAAELGATVSAPPQYWRAPPHGHANLFGDTVHGAR